MRAFLLPAIVLVSCASRTPAPSTHAQAPPEIGSLLHGLWVGKAARSPIGEQPYALLFRKEGDAIVGETPESFGEDVLPPGAYQKFTFTGASLSYRTAMGSKGMLEGEMAVVRERSGPSRLVFCDATGCKKMELLWEALDTRRLAFRSYLDGKLHTDITLEFEGDP